MVSGRERMIRALEAAARGWDVKGTEAPSFTESLGHL